MPHEMIETVEVGNKSANGVIEYKQNQVLSVSVWIVQISGDKKVSAAYCSTGSPTISGEQARAKNGELRFTETGAPLYPWSIELRNATEDRGKLKRGKATGLIQVKRKGGYVIDWFVDDVKVGA
jgi:hypothetical protein